MKGLKGAIWAVGLGFRGQAKSVLQLPAFPGTFLSHRSILFISFFP